VFAILLIVFLPMFVFSLLILTPVLETVFRCSRF
jgi:hypothetical protein